MTQKNHPRSTNKAASKQVQSYACVYSAEREQVRGTNVPQLKLNMFNFYSHTARTDSPP